MTEIQKSELNKYNSQTTSKPEAKKSKSSSESIFDEDQIKYSKTETMHSGVPINLYETNKDTIDDSFVETIEKTVDDISEKNATFKELLQGTEINLIDSPEAIDLRNSDVYETALKLYLYSSPENVASYITAFHQIHIGEEKVKELNISKEHMKKNTETIFTHEVGHLFDCSKNILEAKQKLKTAILNKEISSLKQLTEKISSLSTKLSPEVRDKERYSETNEFKEAYKKDLTPMAEEPWRMRGQKYFLEGVTFRDGIDDKDLNNDENSVSRGELFAECFNVLNTGKANINVFSDVDGFKTAFPNTLNVVEKIIEDNTQ